MKIAFDISPLDTNHLKLHAVRGTGFYVKNLRESLLKFFPDNDYVFYTKGEKIPRDIDVNHILYFEPFFLTLPIKKSGKMVVTIHDLTPFVLPEYFPYGIKGGIKWNIQRFLLKKVDAIITDSISSKKDIIKYTGFSNMKIHVVYLAAADEFKQIKNVPETFRKTYNIPKFFLLYVGDVTGNKNLPRLIRAVKKTDIPLVMVGKMLTQKNYDTQNVWNKDLVTIQKLIEGDSQIISLGFVPTDDLVNLYNAATAFIMPSLYEGFGLPILEAMSCGCPVITTKEGSIPEVAGLGAQYVNAYEEQSIAKGILEVFSNSNLQKELSRKGFEQAKKFSWFKTAQNTLEVYQQEIASK